jgi:NADPH2:quinone reductase
MSHALVVTAHGGPEVLAVQAQERPEPGPGEVLIEVAASGVNFIDVYQREGIYPLPTPFTLGMEGAGRVLAVGADVDQVTPGQVVAWAMTNGSAATYAVVPARTCVPVPDGVDPVVAAAVLLQGMTAQFLTTDTHPVREGTVALVHAAAGGVGQLLVQLLKAKGATVIATAGSAEKCATAAARGADHTIDYSEVDDLAAAIRAVASRWPMTVSVPPPSTPHSRRCALAARSRSSARPRGRCHPSTSSDSMPEGHSSSPARPWRTTSAIAQSSRPGPPRCSPPSRTAPWR